MKKFEKGRLNQKNYDGINPTSKPIAQLLPKVLTDLAKSHQNRPDLVVAVWPEIVGSTLAKQTKATHFMDGVLYVQVMSSTLLSVLVQHEKARLLKHLRDKFPNLEIKGILFKMGTFSNPQPM